jgi:flagellar biosynthetic protein FliQ
MPPEMLVDLFSQSLLLIISFVCILIVPGLLVGLVVAMFQAATQINEQTLSFLPRLLVTLLAIMIAGPWLMNELEEFTRQIMQSMYLVVQ